MHRLRSWGVRAAAVAAVAAVVSGAGVAAATEPAPSPTTSPAQASTSTTTAPAGPAGVTAEVGAPGPTAISGRYIVTLDATADPGALVAKERGRGKKVEQVYSHAVKGFVASSLTADDVAELALDPRVKRIEPDAVVTVDTTQSPATWGSIESTSGTCRSMAPIPTHPPARA